MAENGVSSKEGKIERSGRDLQFNLELDVSEALTGLKAVQREAKQAARAIKELDEMYINEGAALYIKGRLAYGIHPDNLANNLNALNEGRMNFDWGVLAGVAGIEMDKEPKNTGIINIDNSNPGFAGELANYSNEELIKELSERTGVMPIHVEPNHKANLRIPSVKQSFVITGPSTIFIVE